MDIEGSWKDGKWVGDFWVEPWKMIFFFCFLFFVFSDFRGLIRKKRGCGFFVGEISLFFVLRK